MSSSTFGPTFFPPLGPAKVSGGLKPTGWDRCVLGGQVLPAFASVTRGGIKLKEDPKKKAGSDGCHPTYHGVDPQPMQLELETYTDDDREALALIMQPYVPKEGQTPKPVSIDYPGIRFLGITNVQIIGVGPLVPVKPGMAKMVVDMRHWLPPQSSRSATTTPVRAIRNVRKEAAQKAKPSNPPPTQQPSMGKPPAFTGAVR